MARPRPAPRLFVDTSAWFAYVNRKDAHHEAVAEVLDGYPGRLLCSDYVLDETVTLCRRRLGHAVAVKIGEVLFDAAAIDLVRVGSADLRAAWQLFKSRADKPYSFTDCTSFVIMRRLKLATAATLDDDFQQEGFVSLPG